MTDQERADRAQEIIERAISSYLYDVPGEDDQIDTDELADNIRRALERSGVMF